MADKYRRVEKKPDSLPNNEIRVRRDVRVGRYLKRAYELFNAPENPETSVVIKGVSNAMESVVKLSELVKRRVKGLYQLN